MEDYLQELEAWRASFFSSLHIAFQGIEFVKNLMRGKAAESTGAAAAAATVAPYVNEKDVSDLKEIKKMGEEFLRKVSGRF
uniref:Uncharacterized protein n=1 Tax=Chromera velia CCMP2878 TaxID=1169474 RepID=A0A0G4FED6_9ALVE|eukprot:Cvel_16580.t1-p1 / transcript=Cvel_16580.t1 / gene=Cvel_16580 / organism=Chromera_velia_CCMP2878 / gene_product=hypothetical protein / transcript_product=hypothetical protein / location=Cvel_scaffold1283:19683-19922(+) / protein_length=80 / sequence_SO=supercontig / SO=protein_coding / is_pseudo=false